MIRLSLLLAMLLLTLAAPSAAQRMQAKCSACRAVAGELADRLEQERPRNHLDVRHRLDEKGQRYGKVIDYKLSELRVIELLEGLCKDMHYELLAADKKNNTPARWAKTAELGPNREINRPKMREDQRLLESYCGGLIEKHEDEVAAAIRGVKVDAGGVSDYLCHELSKQCPTTQQEEREAAEAAAAEAAAAVAAGSADDAAAAPAGAGKAASQAASDEL